MERARSRWVLNAVSLPSARHVVISRPVPFETVVFFLFLLVVVVVEKPWSLEGRSFHLRWLCSSMNVIHPSVNGFSLQTITPSFIFGVGIFFFHPQEMLTGQENQSNRGKSRKLKKQNSRRNLVSQMRNQVKELE